jgi:hypothetical protein
VAGEKTLRNLCVSYQQRPNMEVFFFPEAEGISRLPPAAVSGNVVMLERTLGVRRLLHRPTRKLTLT